MDEKELIQQVKAGSVSEFNLIVKIFEDTIINICYGFLHNREDAEDIAQEVFIEIFFSIKDFRHDSTLKTWIYRIAVNKSLDYQRKLKRKKRIAGFEKLIGLNNLNYNNIPSDYPDPQSSLEYDEKEKILLNAIEKLPESQKVAFHLHKFENISYSEISLIMDVTIPAVESLLHRAKNNLKKTLGQYYHGNL